MRWESFGDNGTSGTLQCVVNEPASEHEPRTELYIADTLKQMSNTSRNQTHRKGKITPPNMQNSTFFFEEKEEGSLPNVVVCRWPQVFQMVLQFFATETHTHTHKTEQKSHIGVLVYLQHHLRFWCISHLYIRRYFPSRPLSERETSKEHDTGIPLPSLFTSPAGGTQDSRAARACTLDTLKTHITQTVFVKCTIAMFLP